MRRLAYIVCAGLCVCAAAIVRGVDWFLGVLKPEPSLYRIDGDFELIPAFATFADPLVDRHEAGMSHRAAARGI